MLTVGWEKRRASKRDPGYWLGNGGNDNKGVGGKERELDISTTLPNATFVNELGEN